jgi:hypothetical protein
MLVPNHPNNMYLLLLLFKEICYNILFVIGHNLIELFTLTLP